MKTAPIDITTTRIRTADDVVMVGAVRGSFLLGGTRQRTAPIRH